MGSNEGQTYCLRWNNHKSNLVEILDALIKMESYVDCTIVVDEQIQFKAHRVVLAANSPYFQSILQDVPMDHCSILFPGVQAFEMRALLEYMYTGEVNVTQSQIPRIMKIAEQLEVKGLFDMTDLKEKFTKFDDNGPSSNFPPYPVPFQPPAPPQLSGVAAIAAAALTPPTFRETSKDINKDLNERDNHHHYSSTTTTTTHQHQSHHRSSSSSLNLERSNNERRLSSNERRLSIDREREYRDRERSGHRSLSSSATLSDLHHPSQPQQQSSPIISTSSNITQHQAPSSTSPSPSYLYKSPYSSLYSKSPVPSENRRSTEDRNDRFNSLSDRHERQERGIHNERNNERLLQDRQLSTQPQQGQMTPPPPPPPPATTQHTPWPVIPPGTIPTTAAAAAMLSSVYENASDMNPLKRKKLSSISSMLMGSDTPILRNVLAQSHAADSSQPMPLVKQERESEKQGTLNCSGPSDFNNDKYGKYDEPHSPFIDKSFDDEGLDCSPNERLGNLSYSSNNNSQKPEWKRYKQYTRSDILAAIECVRNGMSALQASRKFGVPSRTLYDKVKKLGITTNRPMNRTLKRSPSTGSSSASFPFGLSGTTHPAYSQAEAMLSQMHESNDYKMQNSSHLRSHNNGSNGNVDKDHRGEHHLPPNLSHPAAAALLDPAFLQQAFESRGGDIAGREALHAMALAAAAHAAVNGISTSPGTNGTARSPSPGFALKYSRSHQDSPPPTSTNSNMNLNRTSSSTSQHHQLSEQQQQDLSEQRSSERDVDCMKYDHDQQQDEEDDENDDSRSSPPLRNIREENDVSESRELELMERGFRNRLSRKRNLCKMEHDQDRVEDLSVNRKESTVQQQMHSPSSQPFSPSSSTQQQSSDTNNHHNTNSTYSNSGNQQSSGVIMPPVITKLSTTTNSIPTTSDYPLSLESSQKREMLADETGD